jgi:hypothetical protein
MLKAGGGAMTTAPRAHDPSAPLCIFINYRRQDASGHALLLYNTLIDRFGEDNVFMDIDTLRPARTSPRSWSRQWAPQT